MAGGAQPPRVPPADGGLAGPGRPERLRRPAGRDRSCRTSKRPSRSCRASRCSSPRRSRWTGSPAACWSRARWGGRPRSRGTPTTRPAWARPTPSPRPRSSTFYDPDRSQVVTHDGRVETWEHFQEIAPAASASGSARPKGAGLRILTQTVTSPTLADQLRRLREQFPEAKWHAYEPVTRDTVARRLPAGLRRGARAGLPPRQGRRDRRARRRLPRWGPGRLKDARAFAARREPERARGLIIGRPSGGPAPATASDEPAVRGRVHADDHRRLGRPPAGRRGARRRRDRPGHRRGVGVGESPTGRRRCPISSTRTPTGSTALARDLKAARRAEPGHRRRHASRRRSTRWRT